MAVASAVSAVIHSEAIVTGSPTIRVKASDPAFAVTTSLATDAETRQVKSAESPEPAVLEAGHPSSHGPVEARGVALGILATVVSVWALRSAQDFFVSLLIGIIVAYTLNPLVMWLKWIKVPRVIGTVIVMASVMSALAFGAYSLRGQVQAIVNQLPAVTTTLSRAVADLQLNQRRNMEKVKNAARAINDATKPDVASSSSANAPTRVIVEPPAFELGSLLWAGSIGALGFLGQTAMIAFLVFFLLLTGDTFKRKLVRISGPSLSKKKITIQILNDINRSIQRYMFMLLTTNLLVGILAWIAFRWIGLDNAGAWAVGAAVLHVIPYFGPAVMAVVTGVAAYMQFNSLSMVALVVASMLLIATFVGMFVATWMTGKAAKMNTAAVFISLLFWGWLWGLWGMLLSMPIIVIVKVVAQQLDKLHPVAELLGE